MIVIYFLLLKFACIFTPKTLIIVPHQSNRSAMSLSKAMSSKRLRPEDDVSVSGLQDCLERFMARRDSRRLKVLLDPLRKVTWKTSPDANALAPFVDLWSDIAKEIPNLVIQPTRLLQALAFCQEKSPINFGDESFDLFSIAIGVIIRSCLSKLRDIARSDEIARRAFSKAGEFVV